MTRQNLKLIFKYFALSAGLGYGLNLWLNSYKKPKKKQKVIKVEEDLSRNKPIPPELLLPNDAWGVYFGEKPPYNGYIGKSAFRDGHVLVIGSTGSGKTTGIIRPTLSKWKGHTVQFIIKGDHMDFVNERLNAGRTVYLFEPEKGEDAALRYEPFLFLQKEEHKLSDNAGKLATILFPDKDDGSDVWTKNARLYTRAAIIYSYYLGMGFIDFINLVSSRRMLTLVDEINICGVREAAKFTTRLLDMSDRQIGSIAVDLAQLNDLCSPSIEKAFSASENRDLLDWDILNRHGAPVDIVVAIPESELPKYAKWITLMLQQLFGVLMRREERKYNKTDLPPVLLSLDEAMLLGKIPEFIHSLKTLRSRGVTILLSVQDSSSVDMVYGIKGRKAIYSNCAYKVILTLAEASDQETFSKEFGRVFTEQKTIQSGTSHSVSINGRGHNTSVSRSISTSQAERPWIYPSAFANLKNVVCITPEGAFQVDKRKMQTTNQEVHMNE